MKKIVQLAALVTFALACAVVLAASARGGLSGAKQTARSASPAVLYSKNCATCHGKDGRSKTIKGKLKHATDLTDAEWQAHTSDEHIFNVISNGHEKMPAFKRRLSAEQMETLVGYVRALKK
ncbi:MAG: cytochrome c [Pyrinomonadaceae bacterium]